MKKSQVRMRVGNCQKVEMLQKQAVVPTASTATVASGEARYIALITSIGVSSGFLMPYFIGWVRDTTGTFRLAFIAIAVAMTIGSALAIVLDRPKQRAFEASMALK
ncbi:hypothetical protein PPH41_34740 [Burkholderia gladioli]|nr:hypothetical protein [Burkholderia gladioli]